MTTTIQTRQSPELQEWIRNCKIKAADADDLAALESLRKFAEVATKVPKGLAGNPFVELANIFWLSKLSDYGYLSRALAERIFQHLVAMRSAENLEDLDA